MKWYEKNKAIKKALSPTSDTNENNDSLGDFFSEIDLDSDLTELSDESSNSIVDYNFGNTTSQETFMEEEPISIEPIEPVVVKEMKLSVIQSSTKIIGNIVCEGHLTVYGEIKGNIECDGTLHIYGDIDGNLKSAQIILEDRIHYGNIECDDLTLANENSTIHGNINATNVTSLGKIKGNVNALNHLKLGSKGAIIGDITAKSIAIDDGATIQGKIVMNQEMEIIAER